MFSALWVLYHPTPNTGHTVLAPRATWDKSLYELSDQIWTRTVRQSLAYLHPNQSRILLAENPLERSCDGREEPSVLIFPWVGERTRKLSTPLPSSLPSTSTFRRIPVLGKTAFRRDKSSDPSSGSAPGSPPLGSASSSQDPSATVSKQHPHSTSHDRAPTFPSLAADHIHLVSALLPTETEDSPTYPSRTTGGPYLVSSSTRTSSLPSSPAQPNTTTFPPVTPRYLTSNFPLGPTQRDNMTATMPAHSGPPDFDLEPITYPSHLAQTKPPETSSIPSSSAVLNSGKITDRLRDYTMGSIPTALGAAVPNRAEVSASISSRRRPSASVSTPDSRRDGAARSHTRATPDAASRDGWDVHCGRYDRCDRRLRV